MKKILQNYWTEYTVVLVMLFLTFYQGCVGKTICNKEVFDPKAISVCATKKLQDRISDMCAENERLKIERKELEAENVGLYTRIAEMDTKLKKCQEENTNYNATNLSYIARLEESNKEIINLKLMLVNKKKALEKTNDRIFELEKNK